MNLNVFVVNRKSSYNDGPHLSFLECGGKERSKISPPVLQTKITKLHKIGNGFLFISFTICVREEDFYSGENISTELRVKSYTSKEEM